MVSAPWTPTDFPAAAALACFTALSMPSVTKWTVELGRGHPAGCGGSVRMPVPKRDFRPSLGDVERASTGEHGTKFGPETAKVLGARPDTLNVIGSDPPVWNSTSPS
jgi:hypothetical protein